MGVCGWLLNFYVLPAAPLPSLSRLPVASLRLKQMEVRMMTGKIFLGWQCVMGYWFFSGGGRYWKVIFFSSCVSPLTPVLDIPLTWMVPLLQLVTYDSSSVLHLTVYIQPLLLRSIATGHILSTALRQYSHCGMSPSYLWLAATCTWGKHFFFFFFPNAALFFAAIRQFRQLCDSLFVQELVRHHPP